MKVIATAAAAKGFSGRRLATKVNDRGIVVESIFLAHGKPTEVELDERALAWAKLNGGVSIKGATSEAAASQPKAPTKSGK